MKIGELVHQSQDLPIEDRALVVDSVLRSLNPPERRIDEKWAWLARKRLEDIRSGAVKTIPGEDVFAKIWSGRNQ